MFLASYVKHKSGAECQSSDTKLGWFSGIQGCVDACRQKDGCRFFVYGTGSKFGYCYWEKTTSADCSEGWENDKYDFFEIAGIINFLHLFAHTLNKSVTFASIIIFTFYPMFLGPESAYIYYPIRGCSGRNELFKGNVANRDACQFKCDNNDNCVSYEWWGKSNPHSYEGSNYCQLSSSCTYDLSIESTKYKADLYVKGK